MRTANLRVEHVLSRTLLASKSCAAVPYAFSNAYSDKEVPSKTIHRLVTEVQWMLVSKKVMDISSAVKLFSKLFLRNEK